MQPSGLHHAACGCPGTLGSVEADADAAATAAAAMVADSLVYNYHQMLRMGAMRMERKLKVAYMLPHHHVTGGMKTLLRHMQLLRQRGHTVVAVHRATSTITPQSQGCQGTQQQSAAVPSPSSPLPAQLPPAQPQLPMQPGHLAYTSLHSTLQQLEGTTLLTGAPAAQRDSDRRLISSSSSAAHSSKAQPAPDSSLLPSACPAALPPPEPTSVQLASAPLSASPPSAPLSAPTPSARAGALPPWSGIFVDEEVLLGPDQHLATAYPAVHTLDVVVCGMFQNVRPA